MNESTDNKALAFIKVPLQLLRRKDLSMGAKLAYGRLNLFAGKGGLCIPLQETIATDLGVSRRMIRKYIAELVLHNLVESSKRGRHQSNSYRILTPQLSKVDRDDTDGPNPSDRNGTSYLEGVDRNNRAVEIGTKGTEVKEELIDQDGGDIKKPSPERQEKSTMPPSPVTAFKSRWTKMYGDIRRVPYDWKDRADNELIQGMLETVSGDIDLLAQLAENYLRDTDPWLNGRGRTVALFKARLNQYLDLNANGNECNNNGVQFLDLDAANA